MVQATLQPCYPLAKPLLWVLYLRIKPKGFYRVEVTLHMSFLPRIPLPSSTLIPGLFFTPTELSSVFEHTNPPSLGWTYCPTGTVTYPARDHVSVSLTITQLSFKTYSSTSRDFLLEASVTPVFHPGLSRALWGL